MTDQACGYESIRDPAELRITIRELGRAAGWLQQCAAIAAEAPDLSMERAAGMASSAAVVGRLRSQAIARLAAVSVNRGAGAVVLVDPRTAPVLSCAPGVSEIAVVGEATVEVTVKPLHATVPQSRPCDMAVLTLAGRVSVLWWDDTGRRYQREVSRHQHAVISAGVRFAIYNESLLTATAVLYQSTAAARDAAEIRRLPLAGSGSGSVVARDAVAGEIRESSPAAVASSPVEHGGPLIATAVTI